MNISEKELVRFRGDIEEEVRLSAKEKVSEVRDVVLIIEEKSKLASCAVQFFKDEIIKRVDYRNSRYGDTYIKMRTQHVRPDFTDFDMLVKDITDFYWVLFALDRKHDKDIGEEKFLFSIIPELDDFFKNFFLERHLNLLVKKLKSSDDSEPTKQLESIDEEGLKEYFTSNFKGGNLNRHDSFSLDLMPLLKKKRTAKDYAKIALIIYNSTALSGQKKPNTFKDWYRAFAKLMGVDLKNCYKPSKLSDASNLEKEFSFLKKK